MKITADDEGLTELVVLDVVHVVVVVVGAAVGRIDGLA
jgi:hypothetical protein